MVATVFSAYMTYAKNHNRKVQEVKNKSEIKEERKYKMFNGKNRPIALESKISKRKKKKKSSSR